MMKHFLASILLALAVLTAPLAHAGSVLLLGAGGGGAPATLPLDGISTGVKACYSTRKLLSSYTGNSMTVTRASDSATQAIGFSSNVLNTTALTSFCTGTACGVTTWNDQCNGASGFDQTSALAAAPIIYQSGAINTLNSKPAPLWVAATPSCLENASLTANPVNTLYQNAVVDGTNDSTTLAISGPSATAGLMWRIDTDTTFALVAANTANIAVSSSSSFAYGIASVAETQWNSTSGTYSFWLDRTSIGTGTAIFAPNPSTLQIGCKIGGGTGENFNGSIGEYIAYDLVGGIPSGSQTSIENNQKTYWGTP